MSGEFLRWFKGCTHTKRNEDSAESSFPDVYDWDRKATGDDFHYLPPIIVAHRLFDAIVIRDTVL
jgi:hypothetical protein